MCWVHSFHIFIVVNARSAELFEQILPNACCKCLSAERPTDLIQDLLYSVMLADWHQKPNRFCCQSNSGNRTESAVRTLRVRRQQDLLDFCRHSAVRPWQQALPAKLSLVSPYSGRIRCQSAGILQTVCWLGDYFVYCIVFIFVCCYDCFTVHLAICSSVSREAIT